MPSGESKAAKDAENAIRRDVQSLGGIAKELAVRRLGPGADSRRIGDEITSIAGDCLQNELSEAHKK